MARLDFSVSVFSRRVKDYHHWWSLGFGSGSPSIYVGGRSLSKVRDRFLVDCRERARASTPAQVPGLQLVRGRRLYHLRLELAVRHEDGRTRFSATVPVIVEPRPLGPRHSVDIAYHPLRPSEWFPVDERRRERLEALANLVFAKYWSEAKLGPEQLESLRRTGTESVQIVAFRAEPRSLLAQLPAREGPQMARIGGRRRRKGTTLLSELGFDMSRKGIDEELRPGMARAPYREQLRQLLCGARKAPVLLIGPPGVGKTTLLHRAILDLLEADGWDTHQNLDRVHHVWQISGRRIIAGMSYIGQWEQRCVELLEETYAKQVILWVEDLHAWGRIGESRQNERSLSDFFRGPVARGELPLVAECTPEQYQQLQGDASSFANLFTTLHVEPTDSGTTMRMLVHEARALELSHGCAFDSRVYRSIYELSGSLYSGSAFPGKALELVRALASAHQVSRARAADYRLDEILMRTTPDQEGGRPSVGSAELIALLSERTGMPKLLLTPHERLPVEPLERAFSSQVMGQEQGVRTVCDLILRIKAGLCDPARPYGVYLFTGPTGTGKTELAKALAAYLFGDESRLVRLDMSEYNVPGAAARLIGDRYSPRGVLTSRVRAQPFCVVLLDEVEKAHPSVLNLMLQLFDDGRLSDANGDVADFRHAVIIMTSNLGARAEASIGFGGEADAAQRILLDISKAVSEFFPPELFNRIDRVVPFEPLGREAAEAIARKELARLLSRRGLSERNTFVKATRSVLHKIVGEGFNARDGARSLKRWLEDNIGSLLVETLTRSAAASMRLLWLYCPPASAGAPLQVHEEALREAEAIPSHSRLSELLEQPNAALLEQVPAALRFLRGLERSPRLERLSHTLARLLESFNADASVAHHESDALYNLEILRTEIHELREALELHAAYDHRLGGQIEEREGPHEGLGEQLEIDNFGSEQTRDRDGLPQTIRRFDRRAFSPSLPLRERQAMLRAIAEVWFLERALERADDPRQHVVFLELSRVGDPRQRGRFSERRAGLIEALADAYAVRGRGELEAFACLPRAAAATSASILSRSASDGDEQDQLLRRFQQTIEADPELVVLQLVGPSVREYFAGESGSQVLETLAGDHEIVRVRVLEAELGAEPRALIERTLARREAFVAALEAGAPLPTNPDAMLPIIRRFKLEEARGARSASIEVEDYPLSHVSEHKGEALEPVLELLWLMRVGVELGEERERRRTDPGLVRPRESSVADPLPAEFLTPRAPEQGGES